MLDGLADAEKQRGGNPLGTEGLVDVLRGAVHLLGQPNGCASLLFQLGFEQLAEMQLAFGYVVDFSHSLSFF